MHRYGAAVAAFEKTLERLDLPEEMGGEQMERLGRRAALLGAAEVTWQDHLGPLYEWRQVADVLRTVRTRQGVNDLGRRGRLLALPTKTGQVLYPAFQFRGGRPLPGLPEVLSTFSETGPSPWTVASWFVTSQDELEGRTPVEWLSGPESPEPVKVAARRAAGAFAT
jgi:hypothetical protein